MSCCDFWPRAKEASLVVVVVVSRTCWLYHIDEDNNNNVGLVKLYNVRASYDAGASRKRGSDVAVCCCCVVAAL